MSHVTAKFASALLIGVAAAAVSTALPSRVAQRRRQLPDRTEGETPQGKHWYYRIERGTGRHCWYLRGEDEKSARADDDRQAAPDQARAPTAGTAAARSLRRRPCRNRAEGHPTGQHQCRSGAFGLAGPTSGQRAG